ncbi:C2H2-type zinc finger protein (plasmid) [Haloplanus ruber]|uniref:C2H2-type zinc finger protein n=1 Tax=Haloplanus ruber TaxID=869892 RepID=A0ABD6CVC3_9EURY|nr:C2H2-type zinc finger protein [Haloplanus ruber]
MSYTCSSCDALFQSAAGVSQHVALHHNTCAECDEQFEETDALRNHIHENH